MTGENQVPETIASLLARRVDDDNVGLRAGDDSWTWAEVVAESSARAALLTELVGAGGHVGVLLENVPEYVFLLGAAALSGTVIVGINPTRRGAELERDIRHTNCELVLTDAVGAPLLEGLDVGDVRLIDEAPWHALVDGHRGASLPATLPGPESLYVLLFTSGSTGAPKAVKMTQGRGARTGLQGATAFSPDDALYCSMPVFHGNALLANVFPAIASGATIVLRRRFSASAFMDDIRRYGCTFFNYVGTALAYVLAQPEQRDDADNPLKFCLGSEAAPRDREAFQRRFRCHVIEGYSSSEGAVVIQPFRGMPPEALGRPTDGGDVVIVDPETGIECPRAQFDERRVLLNPTEAIGEIVRRDGLPNFEGYYANPEATAARGRNGWYWTGDLGYRDEDGTFYFAGRNADWLRVDGENFAAGPVERILERFPGVAAVVVYAVPDPSTGDRVMAALQLHSGARFDPAELSAFLHDQPDLGTKWAPRFVRVVDAIPLTATGKVDRNPLRAERWETTDPVWWRPQPRDEYRLLTPDDAVGLRKAFADAGREAMLS